MRDILGITDFKSGAAKTPPFPVRVRIHPPFAERRLFNQQKISHNFATQVSVREDMRPFFRILKTTIYMIKRNQAWLWKIFRAIKSITIFTFRMISATVLGLISIVSIFEWYEKPLNIHLLILAIISIFIVVHQIVIMTYESDK